MEPAPLRDARGSETARRYGRQTSRQRPAGPQRDPVRPEHAAGLAGRIAAGLLYGVVALAPLPFGSNAPVPIAVLAMALGIGLAAAPLPRSRPQNLILLALMVLAGAFVAVIILQLRPGFMTDPVWLQGSALLGQKLGGGVSVVRNQPVFALGNGACCLAATVLGLLVGSDRRRARRVLVVMAWSSLAYAAVGLVNAVSDPAAILGREREDYIGAVLGPFINRNTAALYFGCGAIVWSALLGEAVGHGDWNETGPAAWALRKAVAIRTAGAGLCLAAVVATGSRSGTMLTLFGVAVVGLAFLRHRLGHVPLRIRATVLAVFAGLALVSLTGTGAGQRFHSLGFSDEGRTAVYRAVLPIVASHPWLGTGLGTFAAIYPSYRSSIPGMRNVWDKAHSTPLEMAAETGLPLTGLLATAFLGALALLARGALVRRRDEALPLATAGCLAVAMAHSCVDFSLQIPGFAVVVMAMVGAGLAQSFASGQRVRHITDDDVCAAPMGQRPRRVDGEGLSAAARSGDRGRSLPVVASINPRDEAATTAPLRTAAF